MRSVSNATRIWPSCRGTWRRKPAAPIEPPSCREKSGRSNPRPCSMWRVPEAAAPAAPSMRSNVPHFLGYAPRVNGKFLDAENRRFLVKGVAYGTFAPNGEGDQFPSPARVNQDFMLMAAAGINTVRTYTVPPPDLLDIALRHELRVMVGLAWPQHIPFLDDPQAGPTDPARRGGRGATPGVAPRDAHVCRRQ